MPLDAPVMNHEDIDLLKGLGKDKSVIVTRPDKGRGIAILNRSDYVDKIMEISNCESKFKVTSGELHSIIFKLEDKLDRMLSSFRDEIGSVSYDLFYASEILYGLPTIHKDRIP